MENLMSKMGKLQPTELRRYDTAFLLQQVKAALRALLRRALVLYAAVATLLLLVGTQTCRSTPSSFASA